VGDKGKVDVCYMLNSTTSIYCGSYNRVSQIPGTAVRSQKPNLWRGAAKLPVNSLVFCFVIRWASW
jgi:hypothetical protein